MIHLWPSILVLAVITGLIVFAWYPHPFLQFQQNGKFLLLLIGTAILVGPPLTWLVYKEDKRQFKFDVIVIVLIQLAAIVLGTSTLYKNRPYFMVFTVDRFEVLSRGEIDLQQLTDSRFLDKPASGVILLYATLPADKQKYHALVKEIVLEGKPELQFRPEFWSLFEEKRQLALQTARPLRWLRSARPESTAEIDKLVNNNGGNISLLKYVPAMGRFGQFAAILDVNSGKLVGYILTDPWINKG
jgi:hypothetical protein